MSHKYCPIHKLPERWILRGYFICAVCYSNWVLRKNKENRYFRSYGGVNKNSLSIDGIMDLVRASYLRFPKASLEKIRSQSVNPELMLHPLTNGGYYIKKIGDCRITIAVPLFVESCVNSSNPKEIK